MMVSSTTRSVNHYHAAQPGANRRHNTGHQAGVLLLKDDLKYCQATLNNGSRSFLAASYLLPRQVRDAATALYAFCREADDLIDCGSNPKVALRIVQDRIQCVFESGDTGEYDDITEPSDRALRAVVNHYALPKTLLDGLLEGFYWDVTDRQYATLDAVEDYAARVAGTVGAMMAILLGVRDKQAVARACDLGVAMQLTNICRDIGEDARAGRCYLPQDWLDELGLNRADLLKPDACEALQVIVQRLLARADQLYQHADCGIGVLPRNCQRGIRLARHLYASIGTEIERMDHQVQHRRAVVPGVRKLALLAKHWRASNTVQNHALLLPPTAATGWLVDAVVQSTPDNPIQVYDGLVEQTKTTSDEVVSVLTVLNRLHHIERKDLRASSGRIPYGFDGNLRQ